MFYNLLDNKEGKKVMKTYKKCIALSLTGAMLLGGLTACGDAEQSASKMGSTNSVQNVIDDQIAKEESGDSTEASETTQATTEATTEATTQATTASPSMTASETDAAIKEAIADPNADPNVDVDLTVMSSDMVYATVSQILMDPDSYIGKKVKIDGPYYSTLYEDTGVRYHFVIIEDATACCQQGMEFIWDDGSHVYPDDYPADETRVSVIGTFETYKDNPDDQYQYCHLVDASLEIIQDTDQEVNQ